MNKRFSYDKPERIEFDLSIRVTAKGMFVATLPETAVEPLESCGVRMNKNQLGKPGYVTSDTLDGLCHEVDELFDLAASEELVEQIEVIRYQINTMGNCCLTEGKLMTSGMNPNDYKWMREWFTQNRDSNEVGPFGFTFCSLLRNRKTFVNKLGKKRIYYDFVEDWASMKPDKGDRAFIGCIRNQDGQWGKEYYDIPATPEACKFFADLLRSFYALCERIHKFVKPDGLIELIENNGHLLGSGKDR